jgi:hypothetical protein
MVKLMGPTGMDRSRPLIKPVTAAMMMAVRVSILSGSYKSKCYPPLTFIPHLSLLLI